MKHLKEKMSIDIIGQIKSRKKPQKYSVKKLAYQDLKKEWKKDKFKKENCKEFDNLIKEIYQYIKSEEMSNKSINLNL